MRKALCFSLITIMLVCMACGETQPDISGVSTEYEATKEKMEEKEEPTVEMVSKKEYYQYLISYPEKDWSDYETDIVAICTYAGFDAGQLKKDVRVEEEGEEQFQYEVLTTTIDGVLHEFRLFSNRLSYFCDRFGGNIITIEAARELAEDFLLTLPYVVDYDYDNYQPEGQRIGISYRLLWDDVPMMGTQTLFFTSEENEIPLTGSYISFAVCESGFQSVSIVSLPDEISVMHTYHEEDLLTEEEIYEKAAGFVKEICSEFDWTCRDIVLKNWKLIYMPYQLNGEETVLLPAYEVEIHTRENGKEWNRYFWMDACTGFIYYNNYTPDL